MKQDTVIYTIYFKNDTAVPEVATTTVATVNRGSFITANGLKFYPAATINGGEIFCVQEKDGSTRYASTSYEAMVRRLRLRGYHQLIPRLQPQRTDDGEIRHF